MSLIRSVSIRLDVDSRIQMLSNDYSSIALLQGIHGMWEELHKDPLDISNFLPAVTKVEYTMSKFLRLEMDNTGMDPTRGRVVSIDTLRRQLPRCLDTLVESFCDL